METIDYRDLLTISAKDVLCQAVHEYEQELIKEAFSFAVQNHTSDKEISLKDIQEAIKSLQKRNGEKVLLEEGQNESLKDGIERFYNSKEKRKQRTIQLMIFSLAAVGLVYIVVGLYFYLEEFFPFKYRYSSSYLTIMMGFITVLASIFTGLFYKYFSKVREERKSESRRMDDLIIKLWSQIDYYGKVLMGHYVVKNISNEMPNDDIVNSYLDLINHLLDSPEEKEKFNRLLQVRNKVVHGNSDVRVYMSEKEEAITIAYDIIKKLEIIVKNEIPNAAID